MWSIVQKTARFALAALWLLRGETAGAADISDIVVPGEDVALILVTGEIVPGDHKKFDDITRAHRRALVILSGPGGNLREGLGIGAIIAMEGYATSVGPKSPCYSVCALIWVSGARRYMASTSDIGVHAAYEDGVSGPKESGVGNAEVGAYLNTLGLSLKAIRYFTLAGPDDILPITPQVAKALDIDVIVDNKIEPVEPDPSLRAGELTQSFVDVTFLNAGCEQYFSFDPSALEAEAASLGREALAASSSSDQYQSNASARLDKRLADLEEAGPLSVCVETERKLRRKGIDTGISGPSFNCILATTATEQAICHTPEIWASDQAVSKAYFDFRKLLPKGLRSTLLDSQREWKDRRDKCGSQPACLISAYDERLAQFSRLMRGTE
jgi:hypothetical protein